MRLALVMAAYWGTAKLGLEFSHANSSVTAIWAPTGIALAALLIWGYAMWPAVALGAMLANSWTGISLATVLGITVGNTLEALLGAFLLRRVAKFRPSFERVRDVLALAGLAAVLSTIVSATIGVASLRIGEQLPASEIASTWRVWWLGDMGGDLLVTPFILLCAHAVSRSGWPRLAAQIAPGWGRARAVESVALMAALVVIAVAVFSHSAPTAYLVLPVLVWAALRFHQLGAATASLVVAIVSIGYTTGDSGPFVQDSPDSSLLLSQAFTGVAALTALLLGTLTSQRERAEDRLRRAHDELEGKVRERTIELLRSRRALELQSAITANMGEGAALIRSLDATIIYANEAFERMFGYGPGELDGRPISVVDAAAPQDRAQVPAEVIAALEERGTWSGEVRNVKKDGTELWCHASVSTFRHPEFEGPVWVSVQSDITAEKARRQAQADSEARLAEAQRVARLGSWEWEIGGNVVTWSDELQRIHGLEPGGFAGSYEGFLASVHPDDRERVEGIVRKAFADRAEFEYEHRCVRPDADVRLLRARGKVVVDQRGEPVKMLGVCQDVTELRRAERSLRRMAAIIESSDEAIFSTTRVGTIETWNPGAEQMYGYAAEEIIGRPVATLVPPQRAGEDRMMLDRALGAEQLANLEMQQVRKDGVLLDVIVTVSPIKEDDGTIVGCAFIAGDVTEGNRIREEADRAKDEFFANVSHELRTPLTSMLGYTRLLLEGAAGEIGGQQRQFLEIAERNARRQLRLVSDLLLASKVEVGKFGIEPGPVQLDEIVADGVEALAPAAEEKRISIDASIECCSVFEGDADRLAQLVDNLLSNALKFTPHGGSVNVALEERSRDVVLEVHNSGSYIPPPERERVFERFFRGDYAIERAVAGVGLGLTICKAIAAGHGGTIGVGSEQGAGTTFTVVLPLCRSSERGSYDSGLRSAA